MKNAIDNFRGFLATNPGAITGTAALAVAVTSLFQSFQTFPFEGVERMGPYFDLTIIGVNRRVPDYRLEDEVKPYGKHVSIDQDGDEITDMVFAIEDVVFHASFTAPGHADDGDIQLDVHFERVDNCAERRKRLTNLMEEVVSTVADRITQSIPSTLPPAVLAQALIKKLGPVEGHEFAKSVLAAQDRSESIPT